MKVRALAAAPLLLAVALGSAPARAEPPLSGPPLPATPSMLPGGFLPPRPAMVRRNQDMFNGGIALLIAGGVGLIVGTAMLARPEVEGRSPSREAAGIIACSAAGLSLAAGIPLAVIGGKKVPATPVTEVRVGLGSVFVRF